MFNDVRLKSLARFSPPDADEVFDNVIDSLRGNPFSLFEIDMLPIRRRIMRNGQFNLPCWSPQVDVKKTEEGWSVMLDLPGLEAKDVSVTLEDKDRRLVIEGERTFESRTESKGYTSAERSSGKFSRSFLLPKTADTQSIAADLKNGVLTVQIKEIKEAEKEDSRKIEIRE